MSDNPTALRDLAARYRKSAERAGSSWIWQARLLTTDRLEAEADRVDRAAIRQLQGPPSVAPVAARHRRVPSGETGG